MVNSALLVVDMQEWFFAENNRLNKREFAERCSEIIEISQQADIPVIHIVTHYREDGADWPTAWKGDNQSWCSNLVKGSQYSQVIDQLVPKPTDLVVEKKRFSGFYNTNLDDILRGLKCDHIYVIGYSADVCIRFTAVDAYNRDYSISLIAEGIESFRETKDEAVAYLEWLIGAECVTADEFKSRVIPLPSPEISPKEMTESDFARHRLVEPFLDEPYALGVGQDIRDPEIMRQTGR